jgi:hypothetical protein
MHPHTPCFTEEPQYAADSYDGQKWRTDVYRATDWLGHTFGPGDQVMYCVGAGRGQMMAIGRVQQIHAAQETRKVRIDAPVGPLGSVWEDRLVWLVKVQVLTERTSGYYDNAKRTKPAWVNPMNITAWA